MAIAIKASPAEKHYMIVAPSSSYGFVWGKGESIDLAKKACKSNGAKSLRKCKIYSVHPDTWLDDFGSAHYPDRDSFPKLIQGQA